MLISTLGCVNSVNSVEWIRRKRAPSSLLIPRKERPLQLFFAEVGNNSTFWPPKKNKETKETRQIGNLFPFPINLLLRRNAETCRTYGAKWTGYVFALPVHFLDSQEPQQNSQKTRDLDSDAAQRPFAV